MTPGLNIPASARRSFATDVVRRLRDAGYEAVWAGGCVRDAILGILPKDYDVATSARPDQVIEVFGRRKTIPVGASFGVIMVLGKDKSQGQVEVATFRSDGKYSDGRRPDHVEFCSAEQDALRRDFTINGMFYDPYTNEIIDYVQGRRDLKQGIVRAIGNPYDRIREDKLRMLRAIRFTARFEFELDVVTAEAIKLHASDLCHVSIERIVEELRQMFSHPARGRALRMLIETGLLRVIFPDLSEDSSKATARLVPELRSEFYQPTLSFLLHEHLKSAKDSVRSRTADIADRCRNLKLSNAETETICWLSDSFERSRSPEQLPLHVLKPILASPHIIQLMDMVSAAVGAGERSPADLSFLEAYLERATPDSLAPVPLVTGADLKSLGVQSGPEFSKILREIRDAQLDELIHSRDDALSRVRDML